MVQHLTIPYIHVEFDDLSLRLAYHPPNSNIINIPYHAYVVFLNLPVVVLKGPLKGRSGVIKTVNSQGQAQVELRGSHHYNHRLPELNLRALAFEM